MSFCVGNLLPSLCLETGVRVRWATAEFKAANYWKNHIRHCTKSRASSFQGCKKKAITRFGQICSRWRAKQFSCTNLWDYLGMNATRRSYYHSLAHNGYDNDIIHFSAHDTRRLVQAGGLNLQNLLQSRRLHTAAYLHGRKEEKSVSQGAGDAPLGSEDGWERLLDNKEKRQNIASIPSRRENIFTVPNLLSFSRIIATPFIAYYVLEGQFLIASSLLLIAGVTDILDGQVARRWPSQQSAFGTALDPLGDKILVTVLTLTLAKASMLPLTLAALIVGRDVLLIMSVFYLRYRTCPPPVTLKRYFDPSLVNAKLNPTTISKVNTILQLVVIWASLTAPIFNMVGHPALQCLYLVTGGSTIWSGLSYVFKKDTVQILKDE